MLKGNVLITGGAGFLARGIYRRAQREEWPVAFTCFSRDDAKHVALQRRFPAVRCVRGDVAADRDLLAAAMMGQDIVIHAAAIKYVDLAESNVFDTVRVNVDGSRNVALAAISARVSRVVAISTDKAALPVNVYGMTKAVMERIMVEADRMNTATTFTVCRYGNVVGSTGSLIPKLREQLAREGHVTVTNPRMTRFWMGIDEAVDVVCDAARWAQRGSTLVPMPRAMQLDNVVRAAVGNAEQLIVGLRPGEKMHEDLLHEQESVRARHCGVGDRNWYEIRPPGEVVSDLPFRVTSSEPAGWMSANEMTELIDDSTTI